MITTTIGQVEKDAAPQRAPVYAFEIELTLNNLHSRKRWEFVTLAELTEFMQAHKIAQPDRDEYQQHPRGPIG